MKTQVLHIDACLFTPKRSVTNPRVIFDQCINMHEHVISVYRAAYYHLQDIQCFLAFLAQEPIVAAVRAFVAFRIAYCNSMLYGIFDYNINRHQGI